MSRKTIIWMGMIVGSTVGSALPVLFGGGAFSFSSILLAAAGGFFGIWLAFKISS